MSETRVKVQIDDDHIWAQVWAHRTVEGPERLGRVPYLLAPLALGVCGGLSMIYERDEGASRARILRRLKKRGLKWTHARAILKTRTLRLICAWSLDLEALVREGKVECMDPVDQMGPRSLVRIAQ